MHLVYQTEVRAHVFRVMTSVNAIRRRTNSHEIRGRSCLRCALPNWGNNGIQTLGAAKSFFMSPSASVEMNWVTVSIYKVSSYT